ncbi:PREDICTED: uncharacterized protein LOC100631893 isoform X1 [Amphimedon queenslandica]|uniref:Apoptosis regulator Bcl-2 family BH4 domain-containing protein n=1 Tax=Amphimedon queenslandica TaxID=400682 RepID=A0A1X7VNS3_AMPQE|nr:PREDICTED: uncharacterized protein LOC100631893 isoform X1 [Amphimedon queenslandica]|eukprot:XP_003383388.1 PREDICTED: uncharacterized protein LOC100631893 isoform X1 [Amphimedon queenslandica]
MASKMLSPQISPSDFEDEEELHSVPEDIRNQTQVMFYEYVDSRCSHDRDLSKEQASLLHESASTCIRKTDVGGQGEAAERIAILLCEYGDKFQKEFDNDQNLQKLMTEGTSDTDTGEPSTSSVLAHVRIVVERIFGVNSNGEIMVQNITFGRIASLFYYIYSLCKRFLKNTFANHTLMQTMCALGGYLVVSLVRVKFFQWLKDQGGWGQAIVNISTSITLPTWGNNVILAGGVFLIGLWAYRMYKGL